MLNIPPDKIVEEVCKYYMVPVENVYKKTRIRKNFLFPRQVSIYLIRRHTDLSLKKIAEYFQGEERKKPLDHTTIVHTVKAMENWMYTDEQVEKDVIYLRKQILKHATNKKIKKSNTLVSNYLEGLRLRLPIYLRNFKNKAETPGRIHR